MKKLLSILICVICASHMLYSANVSHTVYVEVCGNTGGKVAVQGTTRGGASDFYAQTWLTKTAYSSTNISTLTYSSSGYTGWGSYDTKFKIFADANDGYYLQGWYANCEAEGRVTESEEYEITKNHNKNSQTYKYYAIFKEQTVYKDYANAVAILVDNNGKPFPYGTPGDYTVKIGEETAGKTCTFNASKSLKYIDNDQGGYWSYTYTAACSDGYDFVGWFEADDDGNLPTTNGVVGLPENDNRTYTKSSYFTNILYTNRANAPEAKTMYAVFRPKLHLFSYIQAEDEFAVDPMSPNSVTVNNNTTIFNYIDNVTDGVTNRYYKIVETFDGDVAVSANTGDFTGTIETIQGMTVLHATSSRTAEELSGTITLSVGGTNRAVLTITATQIPIFVTLNPAENLAGKYTYTQNTTGAQEFTVSTAPIQKQMLTATDYSFAFKPVAHEPTKYQFDRWIIREADGDIIEDVTPNLSYRFSGGETITPVFIRKDAATYIVKSEPKITYLDLQEALDRASALKKATATDQMVVVTSTKGTLLYGEYEINDGVTFLIPGESTYTALLGDLSEEHFAGGGSCTSYCTLTVEDGTTITVKDGNISLFAKLAQINAGKTGGTYNHGHMKLGKNCRIDVQKGGLYAFGFITGDRSSHITMESGTTVYESFFMTDWRGGNETIGNWAPNVPVFGGDKGVKSRVFPVGQYYVQSIEVPMTLKAGAKERLSCCVNATVNAAVNITFISTYDDEEGLFGLGSNTTITKEYDVQTDRMKYTYNGNGTSSRVKLGCMMLDMNVEFLNIPFNVNVNSKDYVMPVQNNIDIEVINTTIDVLYDVELLPGATMRVHDNAIINIGTEDNQYKPSVYVYDRGARKLADTYDDKGKATGGYWGSTNTVVYPLGTSARPGKIQYTRTEADLKDARLIINGDMNIYGSLYTVKGKFAGEETESEGGADITSEGSGRINVYNYGTATVAKQWKQDAGAQDIDLTSPKLLLHNDKSKGATAAYTPVSDSDAGKSYVYYQSDGTWHEPKAGITGVKFYDNNNNEIDSLLITLPTPSTLNGYFLATLEQISDVSYDKNDFVCSFAEGSNFVLADMNDRSIDNGKLRVPFTYTVQDKHGKSSHILSITHESYGELKDTIEVIEDYKPIFNVPTDLTIYGRVNETTSGALLIKYDVANIVTLTNPASTPTNPKWNAEITGTGASYFTFHLGATGNGVDNAYVAFTPNNTTTRKATLKLTAVYTDDVNAEIPSETHTINLVGNGLIIDNTMEFNNVGTITTSNTDPFNLLRNVNSIGALTCKIVDGETKTEVPNNALYTDNEIINIQYTTIDGKGNYIITPKGKVGQVTVEISQAAKGSYSAKTITTTLVVVGEPKPLDGQVCLDENNFETLTEDLDFVEYDATSGQLRFIGDEYISTWTAQFASAPGVLTFTPRGDGYWAVQESMDGVNWSEIIWWTQLPAEKEVYVTLSPRTRKVKISYRKINEIGSITSLCISPFSIYAETTKSYVPVVNGVIRATSIVFTHSTPDVEVSITPKNAAQLDITNLSEPTLSKSTSDNLGGVLQTYYQTTVTLSGGENIPELNDAFNLIATQGDDEAVVVLATYDFPKPLPMESNTWVSDDAKNNINGYDEAEYYNHYMVSSKNVKWDADPERRNLAFLNPGSKEGDQAQRQVVFGYMGLPDELRFESAATGWKIEQSSDGTSTSWVDLNAQAITPTDGVYKIPLTNDPQYVRITYEGTEQNEVLISNLIIEGFPSAVPTPTDVIITKTDDDVNPYPSEEFTISVRNLPSMKLLLDRTDVFELSYQNGSDWTSIDNTTLLTGETDEDLAINKKGDITIKAEWKNANGMLDEGSIQIINPQDQTELAVVRLVGKKSGITASVTSTGIWTGVPDGNPNGTTKDTYTLKDSKNVFKPYTYHEVNLANTFDENKNPLFDYLIIFGETTTTDYNTDILQPTNEIGSNAKTPYYIYKGNVEDKSYEFVSAIANANSAEKGVDGTVIVEDIIGDNKTSYIDVQGKEISVYITGFCPYATTGYTKNEEGVFLFRGKHGDKLDVYLDNCHIYSRNKSLKGTNLYDKESAETYSEKYARGSGGVLVFENMDAQEQLDNFDPFEVNIHTRGDNLLNSNYGCFFGLQIGNSIAMRAYQVSSPIQVHMFNYDHVNKTKTTLNFDDIWPTGEATNGYLALKKQANNAPSIDMGNKYTEVNFKGGQVELQNSQIVSGTYKTTLAISYRAGFFGAEEAGIELCHGIGTDAVDGVVNFIDGTVTVERMKVAKEYRQYYLMDLNADGTESEYTSCLRTPKNTFIKGGSICRVRACQSVTSKGGGPKEGVDGRLLGQYVYTFDSSKDSKDNVTGLATIAGFPSNISGLENYAYNLNSVTPDAEDKFYFWIPGGYGGVEAEKDVYMATWKACMTKIGAGIPNVADGEVGGDIGINEDEEVQNFLYCQLDKNIHDVISAVDDKGAYTYEAPIEVPSVAQEYFNGKYTKWAPNKVGEQLQHQVLSEKSYTIANRVYYITTATADVWKTFTAPFDVANIYVVETFKEKTLEEMNSRSNILKFQAQHNADFAAFFGVAMAMGTTENFEGIYNSYIEWAKIQDKEMNQWNGRDKYTIRGMQKLTPYFGNNWRDANFYLNVNKDNWTVVEGVDEDGEPTYSFDVQWEFLNQADTVGGTLLHKGQTYSLMFPYCPGCEDRLASRDYWDYWSGKFLIFESTAAPQTINGRDFLDESIEGHVFSQTYDDNQVIVSGNSTFARLDTEKSDVYVYKVDDDWLNSECFEPKTGDVATIQPTTAFLYGYVPANQFGMPAKRVTRDGRIIYGESGDDNNDPNNGTTTGSHTPTIGGGNSLFVTGIAGGINIAVAQPQFVQVISATGVVLYNGYVTDNVNVPLPINGIYVVKGENEAQKIFF